MAANAQKTMMVGDEMVGLDFDPDVREDEEPDDIFAGFKPIAAYSILEPNIRVVVNDHDDPALRSRLQFRYGVFLCTDPMHVEVLKKKPGVYFENMAAGEPGPICPKPNCRFSCRNKDAMIAHVATHMD